MGIELQVNTQGRLWKWLSMNLVQRSRTGNLRTRKLSFFVIEAEL